MNFLQRQPLREQVFRLGKRTSGRQSSIRCAHVVKHCRTVIRLRVTGLQPDRLLKILESASHIVGPSLFKEVGSLQVLHVGFDIAWAFFVILNRQPHVQRLSYRRANLILDAE